MDILLICIISYLLGSINMAYIVSRIKKVDLRNHGSKNLGGSNTVALIGWKEGIIVVVFDVLKAIIAVCIAKYFFSTFIYGQYVAGVGSVLGHIFPFYLGFKGGKGTASFVGMMLGMNPLIGLLTALIIIVVMLITDYIVLGTFSAIIFVPVYIYITTKSLTAALIVLIASLVIFYKHLANIPRILNGTEMKFRKANKGEYR